MRKNTHIITDGEVKIGDVYTQESFYTNRKSGKKIKHVEKVKVVYIAGPSRISGKNAVSVRVQILSESESEADNVN